MARLFIRHQPVEYNVEESVQENRFYVFPRILEDHGLCQAYGPNNTDVTYVCIVNRGKCWAARYFTEMGNKQTRIDCVDFSEDPSGQKMILADMILN